jgi:hypothetical protein
MSKRSLSRRLRSGLLLVALQLIALAPLALAGEDLRLQRGLIAAGGGISEAGEFRVQGSVGQFDADPLQPAGGGEFAVTGGFWAGLSSAVAPPGDAVFSDGFETR